MAATSAMRAAMAAGATPRLRKGKARFSPTVMVS